MANWEEIAEKKREQQRQSIPADWIVNVAEERDNLLKFPAECGLLNESELFWTENCDAVELCRLLQRGEVSSKEVTTAFCKRAAVAHQALNCCTEMFFDQALDRAEELDLYYKANGPIGPLHGLPISLKDSVNVKGIESTIGLVCNIGVKSQTDSGVASLLRSLGAVFYVKTNVPQSMLTVETDNNVLGHAFGPFSRKLTAGGSSGGEGALIAMKGSPLGIGTDIGGSIRMPAYCNGIYGIKPSSGRFPYYNMVNFQSPGMDVNGILCVTGPLATSLRSCCMLLRVVAEAEPWRVDPSCAAIPWTPVASRPVLKIGVMYSMGAGPVLPPLQRTLHQAIDKLRQSGHEICEMEPYLLPEMAALAFELYTVDAGRHLKSEVKKTGEPLTDAVAAKGYYTDRQEKTFYEYLDLCHRREQFQFQWLQHWENTINLGTSKDVVDVVLLPACPTPPPPHGKFRQGLPTYWNVLDYPAAVIPWGKVDLSKDKIDVSDKGYSPAIQELYSDPTIYEGVPVGLEIVGRRQQEPKLCHDLSIIEDCLTK